MLKQNTNCILGKYSKSRSIDCLFIIVTACEADHEDKSRAYYLICNLKYLGVGM
jgi:hypothetical protein